MKRSYVLRAVTASTAVLVLAACANGTADEEQNGSDQGGEVQTATLVLGHHGSDTDPRQSFSLQLKELIEEETDGRITVEVHGNSTLGNSDQQIESLQLGAVDIVIEGLLALEPYTPLAAIETAPFLYESQDQFLAVWEGELGDEIKRTITEETGYELLGNMYRGPRNLTSRVPVDEIGDLGGLTIRTPSNPTMVATWQALGARSEALPWDEVYSALEQGVIDGQENPLDVAVFNSIYEVNSNLTVSEHLFANFHFIMWGETLAEFSEEDQQIIRDAARQVGEDYTRNTIALQEEYLEQLKELGMTVHTLQDRDQWVAAVEPIIQGMPAKVQEWIAQVSEIDA